MVFGKKEKLILSFVKASVPFGPSWLHYWNYIVRSSICASWNQFLTLLPPIKGGFAIGLVINTVYGKGGLRPLL
jgi:hypothetical protein